MKILVTGGAGFIGHHIVQYFLEKTDWDIIVLDRLDISGNLNRLADLPNWESGKTRVQFVYHDFKAPITEFISRQIGDVEYILHLGGSTHVDRSIEDPASFAMDNVLGTTNMLNYARTLKNLKRFINFSTDEVFGPAPEGYAHKESDPYRPSNPYSASKAGASAMGYAFFITYGLPVVTTYAMNNFGERQHPEKLIPKIIRAVMEQKPMPIFAAVDPATGRMTSIGSRCWLHCRNTASALYLLLEHGVPGESYAIIGFDELSNLEIAQKIAAYAGKPLIPHLIDFHAIRPGHDARYALDGSKMKKMGWVPEIDFDTSLKQTVEFALHNPQWS
ncbi:MAG: GDP-mannose 4,6-dehydratase [Candidatus Sungbacteria bacterium]|nr:GDP-mannose 4,6-dehydratase [Candidatus Sungbacteria bacterium]